MTVQKLPSGRWRARVWHDGRDRPVAQILGLPAGTTWPTKRDAKAAEADARRVLRGGTVDSITVAEFHRRWTSDPLFARPKASTNLHNLERTRGFVERYGTLLMGQVSDQVVAEWLAGGARNGTVPALRAMFNDAASAKGGRLVKTNPFAGLGIKRTQGNKRKRPPSLEKMEELVAVAKKVTPPSFAAYLEFACIMGARPGELDALRWPAIRFDAGEVAIGEQWNAKVREFTEPKYGPYTLALHERARRLLLGMKRQWTEGGGDFVFETNRGTHYTPSSRIHHWNRVRCAVGLPDLSLYMATRHFFGSYALNVLALPPHVIAEQLGHKDGGVLVVQLYGHPDERVARRLIREAFDRADKGAGEGSSVRRLRSIPGGEAS